MTSTKYSSKGSTNEGYARLLDRAFNKGVDRTSEPCVYWAKGEYDNKATNYVEFKDTGEGMPDKRTYHSEVGTFDQHITLAGAIDVTNTGDGTLNEERVNLYAAIDAAYDIRDSWNPVYNATSGVWERDTLVYGDYDKTSEPWTLKSSQKTIEKFNALIDAAITVFKDNSKSNQDYLLAANALNDGISQIKFKPDSIDYKADSLAASKELTDSLYKISDGTKYVGNKIPGTSQYLTALLTESAYNQKYAFDHSFEMIDTVNTYKAKKVAAMTTPAAVKYYEATEKFTKFPTYKDAISKDSTVAGFDTIAYVNAKTFKAYVDKSVSNAAVAKSTYETAIDQIYSATVVDKDVIKAAMKAADIFADNMLNATSLYAAEINAIAMIDSVAKFVNEKCVNASEYKTLKEKIAATQNIVKTATTIEEIDLQVASLETAYNKAVVNNRLDAVKDSLIAKYQIAQNVMNAMKDKTPLKNKDYQAYINLSKAITTAAQVMWNTPTENKTSVINGPTYDLYDNDFIDENHFYPYKNETPVSRVVRADSTLTHAIDLYKAQYDFETVIDSIDSLHYNNKYAWAYPKQILTDSLNTANVVNGQITDLTTNFGMTPIEKVAAAKKALLEADKLALTWQKTIGDSIKHAQNIDTYSYYKPQYINDNPNVGAPNNPLFKESLDYNETHEALRTKIVAESSYLKNDATTESATKEALDVLWTTIKTQWMADADTIYLGVDRSMKDLDQKPGNGVYKRAIDKYKAELAKDHMTEYQKQIFNAAIANAQAVRGEVVNYDKTWKYPTHPRFYFAIWALDYAMQMSFGVGDFANTETWEQFLNSEDTQLHESMSVVACYLSSGKLIETATVDEVLAEAKKVYESSHPTTEEKQEATSKLKALIRGAQDSTTGINVVNANADAISKDGKFLKNGQLIIVKNGKQYNAAGAQMK